MDYKKEDKSMNKLINSKSGSAHLLFPQKAWLGAGFWVFGRAFFEDKKKAFTLAEVLITLVIIGVIAALTIPNLMQKYTEQTTVKKVQKFYSNLANAYNLAAKDNGPASEWGIIGITEENSNKVYEMLFKPYFKIARNCRETNTGKCITNSPYKRLNNETMKNYDISTYFKIVLEDGATVWGRTATESESGAITIIINYDVNGPKKPNQFGKDTFEFAINKNKVFPYGIQSGAYVYAPFNSSCKNITQSGNGCAAWVIYKGNMDYLHCDLTWDKNSCKEK